MKVHDKMKVHNKKEDPAFEIQSTLFKSSVTIREGGEPVSPFAFIVREDSLHGMVPLEEYEKDDWKQVMKIVASETNADALIFNAEAWSKTSESDEDTASTLSAISAGMSVKELEGSSEIIISYVETKDGRSRTIFSEIDDEGTLSEPKVGVIAPINFSGKLTGFFSDESGEDPVVP